MYCDDNKYLCTSVHTTNRDIGGSWLSKLFGFPTLMMDWHHMSERDLSNAKPVNSQTYAKSIYHLKSKFWVTHKIDKVEVYNPLQFATVLWYK